MHPSLWGHHLWVGMHFSSDCGTVAADQSVDKQELCSWPPSPASLEVGCRVLYSASPFLLSVTNNLLHHFLNSFRQFLIFSSRRARWSLMFSQAKIYRPLPNNAVHNFLHLSTDLLPLFLLGNLDLAGPWAAHI